MVGALFSGGRLEQHHVHRRRDAQTRAARLPLSLAVGTGTVILLYLLANRRLPSAALPRSPNPRGRAQN